mgnify:CR=1 FL=1
MKKPSDAPKIAQHVNPIVIMIGILLLATGLTYIVDSGAFERDGRLVVPGSFQPLEKDASLVDLLAIPSVDDEEVAPVSLIGTALAIPVGLERMAGLIFMVLIIGGMFGIVTHTGAIDAGLEKLLSSVRGNVYILVPALMLSLIHISEPTRQDTRSRMPSSA